MNNLNKALQYYGLNSIANITEADTEPIEYGSLDNYLKVLEKKYNVPEEEEESNEKL